MTIEDMIDFWVEATPRNVLTTMGLTTKHISAAYTVTGIQITKVAKGNPRALIVDVQYTVMNFETTEITYSRDMKRFVLMAGEWYEEPIGAVLCGEGVSGVSPAGCG